VKQKIKLLFFLLSISKGILGQPIDSTASISCKRKVITTSLIGTSWIGSMSVLYGVWYKNEKQTDFHTFNDGSNWLQMDKMGHLYASYKFGLLTSEAMIWSGIPRKKSVLLGAGIGLGYQTTLEIFDGFSSDWGFSWYDMAANGLGLGLFIGQQFIFKEEWIIPKFSFHPTQYAALRPAVLGNGFPQELLKDYNGQTYWFSFNPLHFLKNNKVPKWFCLSIGYSGDAKIIGNNEVYTDPLGKTYHSAREFLLSFDVDFNKINVKKKWVKTILKQLNYIKIPFPALMLRNGELTTIPLYF
jgi:hypothetical protein